ncbi:hypothetical protein P3X46_032471 [Hevea brasiliensis]|uniref:Uncharacterized protein n=1 Tax=Hevea brasiliensis TaxID=3981 RepID=A0ABQ9KDE2_HEVBR|nr:hypothetical protein P3X46_032471 [Hevea brasiliensis]
MALEKTILAIITISFACSLLLGVAVQAQVETPGLQPTPQPMPQPAVPAPSPNSAFLTAFPSKLMGLVGVAMSFFLLKLLA